MKWWIQDWNAGSLPFLQSCMIRAQPLEPDCLELTPLASKNSVFIWKMG